MGCHIPSMRATAHTLLAACFWASASAQLLDPAAEAFSASECNDIVQLFVHRMGVKKTIGRISAPWYEGPVAVSRANRYDDGS